MNEPSLTASEEELGRVVAMSESSVVLSAIEHLFQAPAAAYRDSAAVTAFLAIVGPILELEAWQRVRLLGWMLFVSTVVVGLVAGFGDAASRSLLVAIWVSMIALAMGLMIGARQVATAWREYCGPRR